MRDGLRIISILVMVITLVVASLGVSQARAMAPAVDQMVLCAGNGAVAIHIGASGKPTSPPKHCAECALALAAVVPQVTAQLRRQYHGSRAFRTDSGQHHSVRDVMLHMARGPPFI